MKRAFRVPYVQYKDDKTFEKHIQFVKEHADLIDEIAMFVDFSHQMYRPLEDIRQTAELAARRMAQYREAGIKSVGYNILCTIGHCDEAWDYLDKSPLQTVVGESGHVTSGSLCPFSEGYSEYVSEKYRIFARTKPDFIWSDDDIRMVSHSVNYICFCDNCVKDFNARYGYSFNRETLIDALNESAQVRERWAARLNEGLVNIMRIIRAAVKGVDEEIKLGAMTFDNGMLTYSVSTFDELMREEGAVKGRPGNGYYNDYNPIYILNKAVNVSSQVAVYPPAVTDVQYEFENFPYQDLAKSMRAAENETVLSMFAGCNGVAYNIFGSVIPYRIFKMLAERKQFFDSVSDMLEGSVQRGAVAVMNRLYDVRREVKGDYFADNNVGEILETATNLSELGLAMSGDEKNAGITVLTGRMAEGFTDEELKNYLKGSVMMDGATAENIINRGLGEYVGAEIKKKISSSVFEKLSSDKLNGEGKNYPRDVAITFWDGGNERRRMAYAFKPLKGVKLRALSDLIMLGGKNLGTCSYVYENPFGGKIAVFAYMPFRMLQATQKAAQFKNVQHYLCADAPYIKEGVKVSVFYREKEGKKIILLFNTSQDDYANLNLMLPADGDYLLTDGRTEKKLTAKAGKLKIKKLGSWEYLIAREL